jgi:hypothetical protein
MRDDTHLRALLHHMHLVGMQPSIVCRALVHSCSLQLHSRPVRALTPCQPRQTLVCDLANIHARSTLHVLVARPFSSHRGDTSCGRHTTCITRSTLPPRVELVACPTHNAPHVHTSCFAQNPPASYPHALECNHRCTGAARVSALASVHSGHARVF